MVVASHKECEGSYKIRARFEKVRERGRCN
jgi:hypothetical protein